MQGERYAFEVASPPEVPDLEDDTSRPVRLDGEPIADFPAHHHGYHPLQGEFPDGGRTHVLAVPQDCEAVADGEEFFQSVGNVHKGDAFGF